jgi:hypothetical protein
MADLNERYGDHGAARATARLPGLDIEIVHRRASDGDGEQISILLTAAPSFDVFGRTLETFNPFAFWMQAAQLAWQPWLGTACALGLPWTRALMLPTVEGASRPSEERGASD